MIKDVEGKDMELQFISQRRVKQKMTKLASHEDSRLDIRDFQNQKYSDEEMEAIISQFMTFINSNTQNPKQKGRQPQYQDKSRKGLDPRDVPMQEDIQIYRYREMPPYNLNQFDRIMEKFIKDDSVLEEYYMAQEEIMKNRKKMTTKEFFNVFMKAVGRNLGMRLFSLFISALDRNQDALKEELDATLLEEYLALPRRVRSHPSLAAALCRHSLHPSVPSAPYLGCRCACVRVRAVRSAIRVCARERRTRRF